MTLKGNYSDLTSYSIGDVVAYQGNFYIREREPGSGINPVDTWRWGKIPQILMQAASLVMDGISIAEAGALTGKIVDSLDSTDASKVLSAKQGKALNDKFSSYATTESLSSYATVTSLQSVNPDSKTLRIASSTASSTKKFDITVDDDGELTATEYTPAT